MSVDELMDYTKIMLRFILDWCSRKRLPDVTRFSPAVHIIGKERAKGVIRMISISEFQIKDVVNVSNGKTRKHRGY